MATERRYDPASIEPRCQETWREADLFRARDEADRPHFYVLEMFPYPSGHMHMGHVRVYAIGDVIARFMRMRGYEVLHPMGYDAFGLPAENAAIKEGVHPAVRTRENIASFEREMKALGYSFDWSRSFATCDPEYYRWNQWFFLKMLEKGLVYRRSAPLNWCPSCQTVLANEQVEDGRCWRCGSVVEEREMPQWAFRITAYAQQLLDDLETLTEWPERITTMQRNWIGRSEGCEIDFPLVGRDETIRIFTTRVDTIFGATYMVLAPEHPLVAQITTPDRRAEVEAFVQKVKATDKVERTSPESEKEGVFTGAYALNPFTGEEIPVWVGNFVLAEYGTGAVMSVPAHDARDYRFAKKYGIPMKTVVRPVEGEPPKDDAFTEDGILVDSGEFTGLSSAEARARIGEWAEQRGVGKRTVNWHLRDWGISRQRYWGTPIPILYCLAKCDGKDGIVPVPYEDLPVRLPEDVEFTGEGNPLETSESFQKATCPRCGGEARREVETMDTFVDSSWYYARYCDPRNDQLPFDPEKARRWLPVDVYVGGPEHAVMHLLYFRFWHKVMRDLGLVETDEPVRRLVTQGIVMKDGAKMSKSLGNTVSPTEMIEKFGADTVRMFMLFAAPPEKDIDWNDAAVEGQFRFLGRVWRTVVGRAAEVEGVEAQSTMEGLEGADLETYRLVHKTTQAVTHDLAERLSFNTAIARIMELMNHLGGYAPSSETGRRVLRLAFERVCQLLHPFAPHLTEAAWEALGGKGLLLETAWPEVDEAATRDETVRIAVQVGGKLRGQVEVPRDADEATILEAARAQENVRRHLEGKTVRKEIVVPGRLVNFVVG
ncbi:MAG: leucine--tRNA ligase [Deltaproteobacteria bacterium]|nr:MAG: leucine--tRNA ligase [Deltaproteobacteria bacterium]